MAKERVYIDVILTEDSQEIYFLGSQEHIKEHPIIADVCTCSGYFYDQDNLDEFLEEHKKEIEIVEDYRD